MEFNDALEMKPLVTTTGKDDGWTMQVFDASSSDEEDHDGFAMARS